MRNLQFFYVLFFLISTTHRLQKAISLDFCCVLSLKQRSAIKYKWSLIDSVKNANLDVYLCERETTNLCNSSFPTATTDSVVSVSRKIRNSKQRRRKKQKIDFLMKLSMSTWLRCWSSSLWEGKTASLEARTSEFSSDSINIGWI